MRDPWCKPGRNVLIDIAWLFPQKEKILLGWIDPMLEKLWVKSEREYIFSRCCSSLTPLGKGFLQLWSLVQPAVLSEEVLGAWWPWGSWALLGPFLSSIFWGASMLSGCDSVIICILLSYYFLAHGNTSNICLPAHILKRKIDHHI